MKAILTPGLTHAQSLRVDDRLVVPAVSPAFTGFADMPPVFATAFMVGFVEWTCVEALRPYLEPPEHSVGTHIDMSHTSPTAVGMTVTAKIVLIGINGRLLRFEVSCSDDLGEIGRGVHDRTIIDTARFMRRVSDRAVQARAGRGRGTPGIRCESQGTHEEYSPTSVSTYRASQTSHSGLHLRDPGRSIPAQLQAP